MAVVECTHGRNEANGSLAQEEVPPVLAQRFYMTEDVCLGRERGRVSARMGGREEATRVAGRGMRRLASYRQSKRLTRVNGPEYLCASQVAEERHGGDGVRRRRPGVGGRLMAADDGRAGGGCLLRRVEADVDPKTPCWSRGSERQAGLNCALHT